MLNIENVYEAQSILKGISHHTPLIKCSDLVEGFDFYIKAENLQHTGAFKLRGAYYRMSKLSKEQKEKGVLAASAGNHAQGVAYAAESMNIQATIVMPKSAPLSKVEATRRYGAEVVLIGDNFDTAYQYAKKLQEETGATFIEPFNDLDIIAGQGTIALEILQDLPDVDIVLVPVGGGGLAAGIASVIKQLHPTCKVYGVEASNAACMGESIEQQSLIHLQECNTIADGIAVKTPGDLTYQLCNQYLDGMVTVDDEEIASGILTIMESVKLVSEGAGAVAVTAALYEKIPLKGKKVVSVLSGGNIDVTLVARIIDRGLSKTGRKLSFGTNISDKPGCLNQMLLLLSELNANIVSINHDRSHPLTAPGYCYVEISVETVNHQHQQEILNALKEKNYFCNCIE